MPESITTPRELMVHHLQSMLFVEKTLVDEVLPELHGNVQSPDLKQDIEHHLEETREQLRNLQQIFRMLGEPATPTKNEVLNALGKEYHETLGTIQGDSALTDLFHTGVIAKNEHVEIAAYTALIECAKALDEDEIANLLNENLDQEEEALKKAEKGMKKLLKEKVTV
jgi:ferritin-like metal-binding protein YciE